MLGGTFDPPHEGHTFVSESAIKRLQLQEVWWIVTARNPLKEKSSDYETRLKLVKSFKKSRKIKLVEIKNNKNLYTIDTINYLKDNFKKKQFIWLMGSDNLESMHLWKEWKKIFYNIPIAIFDRPFYSLNITKSRALFFFRKFRIKNNFLKKNKLTPPQWTFVTGLKNNQSSSKIRNYK